MEDGPKPPLVEAITPPATAFITPTKKRPRPDSDDEGGGGGGGDGRGGADGGGGGGNNGGGGGGSGGGGGDPGGLVLFDGTRIFIDRPNRTYRNGPYSQGWLRYWQLLLPKHRLRDLLIVTGTCPARGVGRHDANTHTRAIDRVGSSSLLRPSVG